MNKKLYLIRHSYAEEPGTKRDFDRSLTMEGQSTVRSLGRYLSKESFKPDLVYSSTANRAKETTINLIEELGMNEHAVQYMDSIYEASVRELVEVINQTKDSSKEIVIVGHNPTITYLGELLTGSSIGNMEPSSLVTIKFKDMSWEEVSQGTGIFVSYYHPNH